MIDILDDIQLSASRRPGPVLLRWSLPRDDGRLVQVYISGRLHATAADPEQRQLWLHADRTRAARVELLSIEPRDAWADHSHRLSKLSPQPVTEAGVELDRLTEYPPDSRVVITLDGQDDGGHKLWAALDSRIGFGSLFGLGAAGRDDAFAPGFALGELGHGPFGHDGTRFHWRRDDLMPGTHTLAARIEDDEGHVVALFPEQTIEISATVQ